MRSVRRTWKSRVTARERGGIVGMQIPSQRERSTVVRSADFLRCHFVQHRSEHSVSQWVRKEKPLARLSIRRHRTELSVRKIKKEKRTTGASNVVTADGGKHQTEPEDREGKQAS